MNDRLQVAITDVDSPHPMAAFYRGYALLPGREKYQGDAAMAFEMAVELSDGGKEFAVPITHAQRLRIKRRWADIQTLARANALWRIWDPLKPEDDHAWNEIMRRHEIDTSQKHSSHGH